MNSVTKFLTSYVAAIVVVFVAAAIIMNTLVPAAESWTAQNCIAGARAEGCGIVEGFLTWWWAAMLVVLVPATFVAVHRFKRRNRGLPW